jgi:hypothetical protein
MKIILVNLETKNSTIILSIDDDGPGVDKSEYNNISKPFYKIDKSRSESKSSVGLEILLYSDLSTPGPSSSIDKIIVEFFVSKFTNIIFNRI